MGVNQDLIVTGTIEINASPEKVWDGLTNPEIIREYLFGTETITDWKVGSEIIFQGEYMGQTYKDKGIVRENIPHQLLSYSYWSSFTGLPDQPENYSMVTYKLSSGDNSKTIFTWIQQGFANEKGYEHSKSGMDDFLKGVKEAIER